MTIEPISVTCKWTLIGLLHERFVSCIACISSQLLFTTESSGDSEDLATDSNPRVPERGRPFAQIIETIVTA